MQIDRAIDRILMGHALIASHGGIPLLYMGDEIGLLNDHSYRDDPAFAHDSRWLHRPVMDWDRVGEALRDPASVPGRILSGLRAILARRAAVPELHGRHATEILGTGNPALFAFARRSPAASVVCLYNFAETWTAVPVNWAWQAGATGLTDLLSGGAVGDAAGTIPLPPYARLWIR